MRKINRISRIILIVFMICIFVLSGCRKNTDWGIIQSQESVLISPTPYIENEISRPVLPDLDFGDMNFFEDGYEQVEYESISDGDTAVFVLNDGSFTSRFLAVDTPEINSSENGMEPWSAAAKEYVESVLENADVIILERDEESNLFDRYDRLLVWVWVDGELLNCQIVEQGLGRVNYIYGDYKYVEYIKKQEKKTKDQAIKIWGEVDPSYDYSTETVEGDIAAIRQQMLGKNVTTTGVVTNVIGTNAFIEDHTGAIYVYTNKEEYSQLVKGNEVTVSGKLLEYNGLTEISSITNDGIKLIEQGIGIGPMEIPLDLVGESFEGMYVRIKNLQITAIDFQEGKKGYNIYVSDAQASGCIRVDKYLQNYPEPEEFSVGDRLTVVGNVGQYQDMYQLMIGSAEDIFIEQ